MTDASNNADPDYVNDTDGLSPAIEQAIEDGQRLVSYIAKNGNTELPTDLAKAMIQAKYKAASGHWTCQDETDFLVSYDQLANIVYPVTVESINAIIPQQSGNNKGKTKAENAVAWYSRYTLVALAVLLIAQLYWLVGNNFRVNLAEIFVERETIHSAISNAKANPTELKKLNESLSLTNQKLDANYELLKVWNRVLTFSANFSGHLPEYTLQRLNFKELPQSTEAKSAADTFPLIKKDPEQAALDVKLYQARIMYFKNILAADFFLDAFQGYILPLLYGLFGAFIYVLRSLLKDIRMLTYTMDSKIRYRLRLTLGAIGGMIIGWFLKPSEVDTVASLSPMALAFLMGYNVDVLFSIMDKIIDNIRAAIDKPSPTATVPASTKPTGS